jgi:hypothetical protein
MKQTDKAFWLTLIPAVVLWNSLRPWFLAWVFGGEPGILATARDLIPWATTNIAFSCGLAAMAGYVAAIVASPRYLRAASNVAIGVTIAFGLQNIIEYRAAGLPILYFVILPVTAASSAVLGGAVRALQVRVHRGA